MGHRTSSTDLHGTIPYSFRGHAPTIPRQRGRGRCASRSASAPQKEQSMATCPLTTTELDDVLVTLNRLCPDSPPWRSAATPASERGVILCGPAGLRVLIETAWNAPDRLRISGLFPASPVGDFYPPRARHRHPAPAPADIPAAPPGGPGAGARPSRRRGPAGGDRRPARPGPWLYGAAHAGPGLHCRHKRRDVNRLGAGYGDTGGRCHPDPPWCVSANGRCPPDRTPLDSP
jgi:hypothetical protein